MFSCQEDLVPVKKKIINVMPYCHDLKEKFWAVGSPASPHVGGHPGYEADLKDVVVVGGEGELALVRLLTVHKMLTFRVCHHHVNLRWVSFVGEVSKKSKHGTGPQTQGLKFNSTILQYLLSWNFTGLIFSCYQDILQKFVMNHQYHPYLRLPIMSMLYVRECDKSRFHSLAPYESPPWGIF